LPTLAAALGRGERETFVRGLRRLALDLGALGAAGVLGAFAIGPEVMRLLFGPGYSLSRASLAMLAAASAIYMLAAVFAQSLVALRRYGHAAVSWAAGVIAFFALLSVHASLIQRVSVSFLLGAAVAMSSSAMLLVRDWRAHPGTGNAPELLPIATVET
jgi:O-antigen/teichoic acid export membrane protein